MQEGRENKNEEVQNFHNGVCKIVSRVQLRMEHSWQIGSLDLLFRNVSVKF